EVRKVKLYMCIKSGDIARMRLPLIQKAIKERKAYSLKNLLRLDRRKFMNNAGLCYAQSWSFCHFLMTYPKQEDRGKQIPNGKYRKKLATYYELMRDGGISHDEAWKIAFKGLTLYELEARWKKYVQELDAGKFLGVQCAEIDGEEAKKLGLEEGCTGIRINSVSPDSAAASGDLQKEDILIDFDGKKFQQGKSLLNLRQWMQKVPYGRSIKVIVIRDGKEVEARLKWKRP
ncbi:MAG: PDZ domain-containing protein, partial [Planctomycetota bacterium]|nr:PDZ domain-containing protein [Planctomycetota bacterium]